MALETLTRLNLTYEHWLLFALLDANESPNIRLRNLLASANPAQADVDSASTMVQGHRAARMRQTRGFVDFRDMPSMYVGTLGINLETKRHLGLQAARYGVNESIIVYATLLRELRLKR